MNEDWGLLSSKIMETVGFATPGHIQKSFDIFLRAETTRNLELQNILVGLNVCLNHIDRVVQLEDDLKKIVSDYLPYTDRSTATGSGNTAKITCEHQSYILAEKHLLEYLTKLLAKKNNNYNYRDFSKLAKQLENDNSALGVIYNKYKKWLKPIISDPKGTERNKISHHRPIHYTRVNISVGPKGSIVMHYGDTDVMSNLEAFTPLILQERGNVEIFKPLSPILRERFNPVETFVLESLATIYS